MDVYSNSANEIIYLASGAMCLNKIYKRQLKYFRKRKEDCLKNPTSNISKIIQQIIIIKLYKTLQKSRRPFTEINQCYDYYVNPASNT